jgi:LAGLIDADG DNA endonuclease family protein
LQDVQTLSPPLWVAYARVLNLTDFFIESELIVLQAFIPTLILREGKKGSKYSKPRATKPEKFAVELSSIQKEILVGSLLGDAYIEKAKPNHNARVRFDQTFPKHASYLTWLYVKFISLCGKGPTVIIRKPDKRTGVVYSQMQLKTLAFPCFNLYHEMFYQDKKKIIPLNIAELLTPLALAVWIMDDGGKGSNGETYLHTRSYTLEEVKLLQDALKIKFELQTRLIQKAPGQWVIVIPVRQVRSLKDIVCTYIHPSMAYKI